MNDFSSDDKLVYLVATSAKKFLDEKYDLKLGLEESEGSTISALGRIPF